MERYLLGLDVGTSSLKTAIIDENGRMISKATVEYEPMFLQPGWQEISASEIWNAIMTGLKEMITEGGVDPARISGIGISCLCPGLVALGENGEVLQDPIIYSDRRSVEEAEIIKQSVGEDHLFYITANRCMSGAMSGTSMLWIKNHRPDIYEKTKYFGHINTMIGVWLTGRCAMDHSNASYTSMFETRGGRVWNSELAGKIGIDMAKLPPLMCSDDVLGGLINPEFIETGIPEGTPVVIGGGDTACASLAAGIVNSGDVCESVGTTNVLTVCVDQPNFSPSNINRCHVVKNKWIYQGAMSHAGGSLRWFRDEFCMDMTVRAEKTGENVFDLMTKAASESLPGANGVIFLPYMMGERSPIWDSDARGVFFGMSLNNTRGDLIRAILEAVGYGTRQLKEIAEGLTGLQINHFSSMGGGARSKVWSQIKADIIGVDIDVLDMNDMAPVGAALLAGVGAGIYRDAVEAAGKIERKIYRHVTSCQKDAAVYARRFEAYRQLYPRIKDLYMLCKDAE